MDSFFLLLFTINRSLTWRIRTIDWIPIPSRFYPITVKIFNFGISHVLVLNSVSSFLPEPQRKAFSLSPSLSFSLSKYLTETRIYRCRGKARRRDTPRLRIDRNLRTCFGRERRREKKGQEGRKYAGKSNVRRKQGQFPGARRAVVISFVGWRGSCRYKLPAGSVTRAAPIVNRTNPASAASCRANFREPTYIPLSRVAERGIQFVAVSSIRGGGGEEGRTEGFPPRRVAPCLSSVAQTHCGLKVTVIRLRYENLLV